MKKKTILTAILGAVMLFGSVANVAAAESNAVTFEGNSSKYFSVLDSQTSEFGSMEPGGENTLDITLTNSSSDEMKFYMSASLLEDIAQQGASKTAVYDFDITKNGEGDAFFQATISGGADTGKGANISLGKEYLTEDNNILLDTLKKGESSQITVRLALDGDSVGNDYQAKSGQFQFVFSAEIPDTPKGETKTVYKTVTNYVQGAAKTVTKYVQDAASKVVQTVKTSDPVKLGIIGVAIVAVIGIIIILLVKRKQSKTEEK